MRKSQPVKLFLRAVFEMTNAQPRAGAIVGAAMLENYLAHAIISRLRNDIDEPEENRIFEKGPLDAYAAKVTVGYALNLYNRLTRADLEVIGGIRNLFAHQMEVDSFDHPEVGKRCDMLKTYELYPVGPLVAEDPRNKFLDTVHYIATSLSMEAQTPRPPIEPEFLTD